MAPLSENVEIRPPGATAADLLGCLSHGDKPGGRIGCGPRVRAESAGLSYFWALARRIRCRPV